MEVQEKKKSAPTALTVLFFFLLKVVNPTHVSLTVKSPVVQVVLASVMQSRQGL